MVRILTSIRRHYIISGIIFLLLVIIIALRLYFAIWLTGYVNNVLAHLPGYRGSIHELHVDLYRSAYHINNLKVYKVEGKIPVPFIDIEDVDFSLQWEALLHGRIVSKVYLTRPILNFATDKSGKVDQTGKELDWAKPIKDLMPIDINEVILKDGQLTYKDFSSSPEVNIFIHHMEGSITNFRNVTNKDAALPSKILIRGDSIGGGLLDIRAKANILKEVPDFNMEGKLENVSLPALNDYANSYAAIDFKKGNLSIYSELSVKNSKVSGYIKPIANNISMIDMRHVQNPVKFIWESLASLVVEIFTNHSRDQFATRIEISGDLGDVKTSTWSAITGIVRNAFIKGFDKRIDGDKKL